MNITDVGHLTSDADTGEDKMEKGAKREGKSAFEIAEFYTKAFKEDLENLNILSPTKFTKATDYIKEQIDLIKILESKGFTYKIEDGIYFDSSKVKNYFKLQERSKLKPGIRVEMVKGKKHETDFALWKLTPQGVKRQMEWDSPWGKGFPGWHLECAAMSIKELGMPFDIHCGGIDHIPIHHTNEIAEAESAYNKTFANYFIHSEFLIIKQGKMAKSEGNFLTLNDLINKYNPLSFRYLCLTAHYKSKLNFSYEAMDSSENALSNIYEKIRELNQGRGKVIKEYQEKFLEAVDDDLNTPLALSVFYEVLKGKMKDEDKYATLLDFDKVFGLKLEEVKEIKITKDAKKLLEQREDLRKQGKFEEADRLREEIEKQGYIVQDTEKGSKLKKIHE